MVEKEVKAEETAVAVAPENHDDSKAIVIAESKVVDPPPPEKSPGDSVEREVVDPPTPEKSPGGSVERDAVLARVETTKRSSLIKAWEENEKSKAQNKADKKLSSISSWENTKKAAVEAELRKIEEDLEKKKAQYAEKMKNKVAMIHRAAEEKRAMIEAMRGQDLLKAEEMAAKYHASGTAPKKSIGCFGS